MLTLLHLFGDCNYHKNSIHSSPHQPWMQNTRTLSEELFQKAREAIVVYRYKPEDGNINSKE